MVAKQKKKVVAWSPTLVVIQWLSYVFWALTIIATAYVVYITSLYFLDTSSDISPESVAYGIAALAILSPLAIITDLLYSRRESVDKHSAPAVVMVIHAVLAGLIAIGSLISLVFTSINLLFSTTSHATAIPTIITAAILFTLFLLLTFRITRPMLIKPFRLFVRLKITAVSLLVIGFAIAGPVVYAVSTREDRMVRDSLSYINTILTQSTSEKSALPETIELTSVEKVYYFDTTTHDATARFLKEGTITYTPNTQPSTSTVEESSTTQTFYYKLCATFTHALRDTYPVVSYPYAVGSDVSTYRDTLDLNDIQAGTKCFDLKTTIYTY